MIADSIKNASFYEGLSEDIATVLKYLQKTDFSKLEPGRYEIEGSVMSAGVSSYVSKPFEEGKWEAHRKYIDVHYIAEGTEKIGYAFIEQLQVIKEYDEKGDYLLLEGEGDMLVIKQGMFAIFAPQDAHMPCIAADEPQKVKKVMIKIKV